MNIKPRGAELIQITRDAQGGWNAGRAWKSMALKSKLTLVLVKDNYIFGLDDGIFTCVDPKTGQRQGKDGWSGHRWFPE